MELGRKTVNLLWSPACWPISNWKAAQICANMNSDTKKKHQNENFQKNAISEAEMMEFGKKRWTTYGVLLIDPFPIEKLHKFMWIWILTQKKTPKWKFLKKCHFEARNDGIGPKNKLPPMQPCSLTHFESKSYTNLHKSKFWHKNKNEHWNDD